MRGELGHGGVEDPGLRAFGVPLPTATTYTPAFVVTFPIGGPL
ncbi:hypothetical protein [Amycolatopsis thermoflava]|nr:hypothetical protein [Amycolatopsis thermoflava]